MSEITIGRLRGKYCVSWHAPDGRRRRYQLEACTRKEAESEGRDRYLKERVLVADMNTRDIWESYRIHLGQKPTAKTISYTGKAVLSFFGELRPDQITTADCRAYTQMRLKAGKKVGTIHTELGHLRSAFVWAKKAKIIADAPDIEKPPKPDSDVRPLSDTDIAKIIDGTRAPHIRLAVILLLTTGARVSAILDRTWDKIDFERGIIDLRLSDGVTRKGRAVLPMNRLARTALQTAYAARQSDFVIEHNGKPVKSIRKGYYNALARAGLTGVNIHQIRHTVAVKLLSQGKSLQEVSQFLGHSNTVITEKIYARFQPERLAGSADILNIDLVKGVSK